ncbi:MAG TPA: prolyl oligopeptidase family serine peptidase [Candidatus Acidoferrum sp.]|nr:prolyl oligopeptidase family serine peptidase [Candidatus Acidoferrum sp.]
MAPFSRGCVLVTASLVACLAASAQEVLPGSQPLTLQGDLSVAMVAGIDKFLTREAEQSLAGREKFWHRDFSSAQAYSVSVQTNRQHLRRIIGAVDERLPVTALEFVSSTASPAKVGETALFTAQAVRWPVFEGVFGEGLLLEPKAAPIACVVAIPDADQTPEMLAGLAPGLAPERQWTRRLAENGCCVLVPVTISRDDAASGNRRLHRTTNLPHREWIYRQAYPLGRHIIGYEVQKVAAAVDFFQSSTGRVHGVPGRIGVAGYGEGGLLALYAAALDERIGAALVSGYFEPRQHLWEEPIYRNVFGLLREFGDAEVASLVSPRALIVEYSKAPQVEGPPRPQLKRQEAAPGKITTPDYSDVEAELERARALVQRGEPKLFDRFTLICGNEGVATGPGSDRALVALLNGLNVPTEELKPPGPEPKELRPRFDPAERQQRQVRELEDFTQRLLRESDRQRDRFFWRQLHMDSVQAYETSCLPFRQMLSTDITGRFESPALPPNPRTRRWQPASIGSTNQSHVAEAGPPASRSWTSYEVVLDVYSDVFAWGILLVPADLKPGERRPVVVCQHGLEGLPADVITRDASDPAFHYYQGYAARLAESGFVVFAPHNPYRGGEKFRQLQRKANPLGGSLFSIIIAQHNCILDWLATLPFVDAGRIGFYGLSYGGVSAMRVPAVLDRYACSICSAAFNDWTRKVASTEDPGSYMFLGEYEMPDFNLGETFGHAEMAALIAPRPFMVERGHSDTVGQDEWVAGEYAKVRRLYDRLDIGERTEIEFFNGGHTIHGVGTFDFLRRSLGWPKKGE